MNLRRHSLTAAGFAALALLSSGSSVLAADGSPTKDEPTTETKDETPKPKGTNNTLNQGSSPLDHGDTITGKSTKKLADRGYTPEDHPDYLARIEANNNREYPAYIYVGADSIGLDPEFVYETWQGTEMLFKRQYKQAKSHFDMLGVKYRGQGIGPVGHVLVWQALMLENFDFRYETQYRRSYNLARQELEEAILSPGNQGWEYFLLAGMMGIDSIHAMRHEEYVTAFNRGYDAMKAVKSCKKYAPNFADVYLGDGLFDYWATVISRASKAIPDTDDKRQEGITQMVRVELQGTYLRPAATLALTYTWIEEGKRRQALASALKNKKNYPNNIINTLVLGRVYMYNRMFKEAEQSFLHVLEVAPDNRRVHFYLGRLYMRQKRLDEAEKSLDRYLAFDDLEKSYRASTTYYKGNIYYQRKDWDKAEKLYKEAWRIGKIKRAKRKLEKVKEKRAAG